MIVRSRSPLRLGLAGGGTDLSPYCDKYGGCVLNATIDMYAHCTIEMEEDCEGVFFDAQDIGEQFHSSLTGELPLEGRLILHKAVYNRVIREYNHGQPLPIKVYTHCDAPPGSGLGSSSTMVVTMISAYQKLLNLPLGEYDIARLAYDIERVDCQLSGGKQDQYATTFGGFNFMEFYDENRVLVNPLRIRRSILNELETQLLLYFTGVSRSSAKIIDDQVKTTSGNTEKPLQAMHDVKQLAFEMKERLLHSDIDGMSKLFQDSWVAKKATSPAISTPLIEQIEDRAISAGATSLKISGAGGGGFMMLFVDPLKRIAVENALEDLEGTIHPFKFTQEGTQSWKV
ncbi:GHMP family kinase ATP-binding protein [Photobacterium aphoticum]|uniref:Dehydrogenase n=2 Tax=Photobacterium aphoticum TaxID=754436 RepID=A0A0J1GML7_9GAMM|nr:dehydrogenase [Photobacterium aphoticum]PSU58441.1 dehydrogenase [Photobacterium aphoticum]GHA37104.1 dehydrogenase [Photobacterium aphoticum]